MNSLPEPVPAAPPTPAGTPSTTATTQALPAVHVQTLGLIGCGLLGGSFAAALKQQALVGKVVGYSKSSLSSELALKLGAIDEIADSAAAAAAQADVVLLAVPVSATEGLLKVIRPVLKSDVLVMDVGSTKRDVADAARRALRERVDRFVPAHPIAGKEASGVEHADARLFAGRQVILTPFAQNAPELVLRAAALWSAVGGHVLRMTPHNHDAAFAAVSHLPHLLAFAYFNAVQQQPSGHEYLYLAGSGFRDFTRIAASSAEVWRDVLIANREEVLAQVQELRKALFGMEQAMLSGNAQALEALIRAASDGRSAWRMGQLPQPTAASSTADTQPAQTTAPAPIRWPSTQPTSSAVDPNHQLGSKKQP